MESAPNHPAPESKPLQLEDWRLTVAAPGGVFTLRREPRWRARQYRKALHRVAFAILLTAIAIGTLRSGLGVPNPGLVLPIAPQRLPEIALLLSVIFLIQAGWIVWQARRAPGEFRVREDSEPRPATEEGAPQPIHRLQQRRDDSAPWEAVVTEARAVVVSERWGRRGRNPEVSWGGLHLWPVAEDRLHDLLQVDKQRPDPGGETDLQRVGQQLARALSLPYHYLTRPASVAESRRALSPTIATESAAREADLAADRTPAPEAPLPAEASE